MEENKEGLEKVDLTKKIKDRVSLCERLVGLSEECAELNQAALKYRRALDPTLNNPTPITEDEAYEELMSEIADVSVYLGTLSINWNYVTEIGQRKLVRWAERLEREHE